MVEELKKLDFKILGVITNNYVVPSFNNIPIERIITYRLEDTKKMVLLDISDTNNLSTKNNSKLQLAKALNDKYICLYDFTKGLNNKELMYYSRLFRKITEKYGKKIMLFSKDINNLINMCDKIAIYDKKIIYTTDNMFDDKLYNYIDMPNIVKFIKLANKKGAGLDFTKDLNELIKDIYRRLNAGKDCI